MIGSPSHKNADASDAEAMSGIQHLSVSQIERYSHEHGGCHAKWWWEKVAKFREPQTDPMVRGIIGHRVFEHYLLTGKLPAVSEVEKWCLEEGVTTPAKEILRACTSAAHLLPRPEATTPDQIEQGFEIRAPELVVPIIGFFDYTNTGERRILDYKFRSAVKWAKTEAQLLDNIQANLYAIALNGLIAGHHGVKKDFRGGTTFIVSPTFDHEVLFQHLTAEISSANHSVVTGAKMQPNALKDWYWNFLVPTVREMYEASQKKSAADVGHNHDACYAYRKTCFHYDRCVEVGNIVPPEKMGLFGVTTKKESKMSSILQRLLMQSNSKPAAPAAPVEAAAHAEAAAPVAAPVEAFETIIEAVETITEAVRERMVMGTTADEALLRQTGIVDEKGGLTEAGQAVEEAVEKAVDAYVVVNIAAGALYRDGDMVRKVLLELTGACSKVRVVAHGRAVGLKDALDAICLSLNVPIAWVQTGNAELEVEHDPKASRNVVVEFPGGEIVSADSLDLFEHWDCTDVTRDDSKAVDLPPLPVIVEGVRGRKKSSPRTPDGRVIGLMPVTELREEVNKAFTYLTEEDKDDLLSTLPPAGAQRGVKEHLARSLETILRRAYGSRCVELCISPETEEKPVVEEPVVEEPVVDSSPEFNQSAEEVAKVLDAEVDQLRAEVEALEKRLRATAEDNARLAKEAASRREENEALQVENEALVRKVSTLEEDVEGCTVVQQEDTSPKGRMLLVNILPAKGLEGKVAALEDILGPIQRDLAKDVGLLSYLLMGFRDGPKGVAARLDALLYHKQVVLPQILTYSRNDPCYPEVFEVVRRHCTTILMPVAA